MIKKYSVRNIIMTLLKKNFGELPLWKSIETDLAIKCANLPEALSDKKKGELIEALKKIKIYLIDKGLQEEELKFFQEEIDRYEETNQITLYSEEDDYLDPKIIDQFARLGIGSEGILGIQRKFNYAQLRKLTNGVYKQSGLIKFYISREQIIKGQIIAELFEHAQKIPIATLWKSKSKDSDTNVHKEFISLFGDKLNLNKNVMIKEIEADLYFYRFISESNEDMIIISTERQIIGDYSITGVRTHVVDYKQMTQSMKLPTKLPYFFVQTLTNRVLKFKNHKEFFSRIKELKVKKETFFDFPFSINLKAIEGQLLLKQPKWFKWLVWSWLTHEKKGLLNPYPMHILMIAPPSTGKSWLFNSLHVRSNEVEDVFSGTSSTLKKLIPSFKYNPAEIGYLAKANRFAYCDEIFRCFLKKHNRDNEDTSVAALNDLMEHQKRQAGSGVSSVYVNMTARIFAAGNPPRGCHNMTELMGAYDHSWLSRSLIYYQNTEHIDLIKNCRSSDLKKYKFYMPNNDWVSIIDYLHSFSATYDEDRVYRIYDSVLALFSETLLKHYRSRHTHHIECMLDGIIKTRCMLEYDTSFAAKEEDYENLQLVWKKVVQSWIDFENLSHLPITEKIYYLPETVQYLYWEIAKKKRALDRIETEDIALKEMTKSKYIESMVILKEQNLIYQEGERIIPFFLKENNEK